MRWSVGFIRGHCRLAPFFGLSHLRGYPSSAAPIVILCLSVLVSPTGLGGEALDLFGKYFIDDLPGAVSDACRKGSKGHLEAQLERQYSPASVGHDYGCVRKRCHENRRPLLHGSASFLTNDETFRFGVLCATAFGHSVFGLGIKVGIGWARCPLCLEDLVVLFRHRLF